MGAQAEFYYQDNESTNLRVMSLKESNQDFEWYPTSDEIINLVGNDLSENYSLESLLDVGAGDGRVLEKIEAIASPDSSIRKYAIEKARPHLNALNKDIFVVGTDFLDQNLMDKKVDAIFCNPPFSEFDNWLSKIIREANATVLYFVVPVRWAESKKIAEALEWRKVEAEVIGSADFYGADRNAQCKVDIVKVAMRSYRNHSDPFDKWFDEYFKIDIKSNSKSEHDIRCDMADNIKNNIHSELVPAKDLITSMVAMYQSDLEKLMISYHAICDIDPILLIEMDVNITALKTSVRLKLTALKDSYWKEFFSRLTKVTDRLCSTSRARLLGKLNEHTSVDFTKLNAYAVTEWVIKNSDSYIEEQFLTITERLFRSVNVIAYKSNEKTFKKEDWRYRGDARQKCMLDYRVVLTQYSAIYNGHYIHERSHGLTKSAGEFIDDILVLSYNLGFDIDGMEKHSSYEWEAGKEYTFNYKDVESKAPVMLMKVRAYKNGNFHIKFSQKFLINLNVEFGRLKGWVKSKEEAFEEMSEAVINMKQEIKDPDVIRNVFDRGFKSTFQIAPPVTHNLLSHVM